MLEVSPELGDEHVEAAAIEKRVVAPEFEQDAGSFGLTFNVAELKDGDYSVRILGTSVTADYIIRLETPKKLFGNRMK